MPETAAFAALGDERFLSLTTFRRTGEPVSTPVWIGRDGDALVVTTPVDSGKVKRVRNNGRVELRPCSRSGAVEDGAPVVTGSARVLDDEQSRARVTETIRTKYGLEYRIVMLIERVASRSGRKPRVILSITPA